MGNWRSFGTSIIGPGHVASGIPNQDAWLAIHQSWADGVVVSDGLGSRLFSSFGSHLACLAVADAFLQDAGGESYPESIERNWLSRISPLNARDCPATCIYAFRPNDGFLHLGLLGDGLVSVLKQDGEILSLFDDKEGAFSNQTVALSSGLSQGEWKELALPENICRMVFLCTDGVADDLVDMDGFLRSFFEAYRTVPGESASQELQEMLLNWPVPKHTDDKTIACLYHQEGDHE